MDPLTPSRKRRGDASRIDDHETRVLAWLEQENHSYREVVQMLAEDGLTVSVSAVCRWYQARKQEQLRSQVLRNITSASSAAREIRAQAREQGLPDMGSVMDYVGVLATQMALRPDTEVDPTQLAKLLSPLLEWQRLKRKDTELQMDREKLELLKAKAAQADQTAEVAADQAGTPEERMAKIRAIFGMST